MATIPDMTFEKIVEKTKAMLGKNYREPEIIEITESLSSMASHEDEVNVVKYSPNEKIIASGAYDKQIKIYDYNLQLLSTITGHKRGITDLSFSLYAKILVSSSTDKTIKILESVPPVINDKVSFSLLTSIAHIFPSCPSIVLMHSDVFIFQNLISPSAPEEIKCVPWYIQSTFNTLLKWPSNVLRHE